MPANLSPFTHFRKIFRSLPFRRKMREMKTLLLMTQVVGSLFSLAQLRVTP